MMIFCLFSFICPPRHSAQTSATEPVGLEEGTPPDSSFKFEHLLLHQAAIWTAPLHIEKNDLCFWGPAVAGTVLIIIHDEKIYRGIKRYQANHGWVDWLSPRVSVLGDGDIHLGILGTLFLGGMIFKDQRLKETGGLCLQTLFHTAVVVNVLKHAFGRQRPDYGDGRDDWHGFTDSIARYTDKPQSRYNAFPSGHTIIVWGSAAVISKQYRESVVVPVFCYSLATLVGLSRVTEGRHWLSDVVAGAVLGHAIGKYIVRKRGKHLQVMPALSHDKISLSLTCRF